MEAYLKDMDVYPHPCNICGLNTHPTDSHVYINFHQPKFNFVELIICDKCGSRDHTTNDHIVYRIEKYNINITPDPICTKCLGDDHPRKYCDIYKRYYNRENGYYNYLDQIYSYEKESLMIDYCKNHPTAIKILNSFHTFSLDQQISFLYDHNHFPAKGLQPFWDIIYKQHSTESIESIKMKYFNYDQILKLGI
jgi:hypothetical protein